MEFHILLVFAVWWLVTYFFMVNLLLFLRHRTRLHERPRELADLPPVSVVVPAFNEEAGIADTVASLLAIDYPRDKLELIIVNDGSRDRTAAIVQPYADAGDVVFVNNQLNQGKSTALNIGFETASSDFVVTIDADTVVEPRIIQKTLPYFFEDEKTAAVVVHVQVRNPRNWLEKIIAVEYHLGLGFYLKLFSFLDSLYLTPGQFSIYRRDIVLGIGGFDPENIVEDTEIAYRLQKAGYRIACCLSATASTTVPNTIRTLYYQRKRWYTGTVQTWAKHPDIFFNRQLGNWGLYFMPANVAGIILAATLFSSTVYLIGKYLYLGAEKLWVVDFDVVPLVSSTIEHAAFDPLALSMFVILASTPFLMNMAGCFVGLHAMGARIRDNPWGYAAFLFFFIPYNVFWLMSFYFAAAKAEVKWRESM